MTPEEEKNLQDWYTYKFRNRVDDSRTLGGEALQEDRPEDWKRLQIWDGQNLVPAMPDGFRGTPSPEQQARLQRAAQEGNLFLYRLNTVHPCRYDPEKTDWIDQPDLESPQFPKPEPRLETYTADVSKFKLTLNKWFGWLGLFSGEKRKLEQRTAQYNADHAAWNESKSQYEVLKANADRRRETLADGMEAKEAAYREAAVGDIRSWRRLEQFENTMDSIFAPRPREVNPVVAEKYVNGATMDRQEFAQIAAHGYDLPENSRITPREAAAVNLALSGAASITQPAFESLNPFSQVGAKLKTTYGYNMMVTGLFGISRVGQEWDGVYTAFDTAKEAISDYQNGKPEKLGRYLGEGLRNLVNGFPDHAVSGLDKTSGGLAAGRILEVLDNHPDLMANSGLSEKELQDARGSVALSKISLDGLKAKLMLQQAAAGLRELSPEEKGRCLADMTLLALSDNAIKTARETYESTPEYLSNLEKMGEAMETAMQKKADFIKNHPEEIRANFKKVYPKLPEGKSLDEQYDMVYDKPQNFTLEYDKCPISDYQTGLGRKNALETVQNHYRNDPTLQNAAKGMSPKEILDTVKNPKELGKLMSQSALGKQPVNAPTQEKQMVNTVSAPVKQPQQKRGPAMGL